MISSVYNNSVTIYIYDTTISVYPQTKKNTHTLAHMRTHIYYICTNILIYIPCTSSDEGTFRRVLWRRRWHVSGERENLFQQNLLLQLIVFLENPETILSCEINTYIHTVGRCYIMSCINIRTQTIMPTVLYRSALAVIVLYDIYIGIYMKRAKVKKYIIITLYNIYIYNSPRVYYDFSLYRRYSKGY